MASVTANAVFVDANPTLGSVMERLVRDSGGLPIHVNRQPDITVDEIERVIGNATVAIIDHTALPTEVARNCPELKHVVFLGTGARSYMNPEELATVGVEVHTIKGYGDTAVAECAFALMWAAAKKIPIMDRNMREGIWLRSDVTQLTGKTLGLVGYGGIAAELARLARGVGMQVRAWNRTPKDAPGVSFVSLDALLAECDVLSLHLLLNDETRDFLSQERISQLKPGAILVNTARGALVDEQAMIEALKTGRLGHAALDVFNVEPLPADHPLTSLENVTLSAHSAFRTAEANLNLIGAALEHYRRIVATQ